MNKATTKTARKSRVRATKVLTAKQQAQASAGVKVTTDTKAKNGSKQADAKPLYVDDGSKGINVHKGTKPQPAPKPVDPKLLQLLKDYAEKNKTRNGWEKVAKMKDDEIGKVIAGAKTENAVIKRMRKVIESASA